jgi:hypothetical protein
LNPEAWLEKAAFCAQEQLKRRKEYREEYVAKGQIVENVVL